MADLSKQSSSADHVEADELSTLHAQMNKILTVLEGSLKKLEADHSVSEDKADHSVSKDKTDNLKTIKEYRRRTTNLFKNLLIKKLEADPSVSEDKADHSVSKDKADHSVPKDKTDNLKIIKDLRRTINLFNKLVSFETTEGDKKKKFLQQVRSTLEGLNSLIELSDEKEFKPPAEDKLKEVHQLFSKLYLQIPSSDKLLSIFSEADRSSRGGKEVDNRQVKTTSPDLHTDEIFKGSPTFRDLRVVYDSLGRQTKLCFLCFAIIPENEVVKKRLMTSWWVGEGFVSRPTDGKSTNEEIAANRILDELVEKGLIEPIYKKRRSVANSYKMNPLIRSVVIVLAEKARLFDFDQKLNPIADFQKSYRACLVKGSLQQLLKKDSAKLQSGKHNPPQQLEKLQTIFNVSEPYPGFSESEGFSKLKNLKVLYLGATQSSAKRHIELESADFLKELKIMKHLRFFSLQGISTILNLPNSVYKLSNLRILDLRACHHLEVLPNGIESLKKLTHLDLSECYMLDNIPKGVGKLQELQVLKGFVIGGRLSENSCALADLSGLKQLRKLSIYTNRRDFPKNGEILTLLSFEELQKLTIVWGAEATTPSSSEKKQEKGKAPLYAASGNLINREQDRDATQPNSLENKEQDKDAPQPVATPTNAPKKNGDQEKQEKVDAEPKTEATTNPTKNEDHKELDMDEARPIAATINGTKKEVNQKMQDTAEAEPTAPTTTYPTDGEDNKQQDIKDAIRPVAEATNGPKKEGDQKKQDKAVAEPTAAITKNPTDGEENKEQDKDAGRPVVAATNGPKEDDQKKQDKAEAEPTAATTTNPTDGEENKELDNDAVRPGAATNNDPKKDDDQNKQDKAKAKEGRAPTTTNPTNSGDINEQVKVVARPIIASSMNPETSGNKGEAQPIASPITSSLNTGVEKKKDSSAAQQAKSAKGEAQPIASPITSSQNTGVEKKKDSNAAQQAKSAMSEAQPIASPITSSLNTGVEKKKDRSAAQQKKNAKPGTEPRPAEKFKKLKKLNLQCYRETKAPSWLVPDKLENLQKLYIRGGELRFLGSVQENDKWNKVELLSLKFLSDLKMDWKEIRSSFPELRYLEKFKCPQITFCPCDENGVWLSPPHQNEGRITI